MMNEMSMVSTNNHSWKSVVL